MFSFSLELHKLDYVEKCHTHCCNTGILSHIEAMLRDWAVKLVGASCSSQVALSSIDYKTRYTVMQEHT